MKAKFIKEISITDPDSKGQVDISIFKHENGGMFAVDSSYLDQCFEDEEDPVVPDVFGDIQDVELNSVLILTGTS